MITIPVYTIFALVALFCSFLLFFDKNADIVKKETGAPSEKILLQSAPVLASTIAYAASGIPSVYIPYAS